jgi:viroplasmin and RNaseH domain-containing protein
VVDLASKFYAVKAGRVPGIYEVWAGGAEDAVKGFSGASFKGANTVEGCLDFLEEQTAPIYANFKDAQNSKTKPKTLTEILKEKNNLKQSQKMSDFSS